MSFGWSYPPGVTGNEYAIAGPSWEGEYRRYCRVCDTITVWDAQTFHGEGWGTCQTCDDDDEWYLSDEE